MEIKYIVDIYNPFQDNENVTDIYTINGHKYCIRMLNIGYDWGVPQVNFPEKDWDDSYTEYYLYSTKEEAKKFIKELKGV